MTDEFNNDSLLELYLYESTSLLDSLDDILLGAESDGCLTSENVNEIFRIMHTIKGSSTMMAYTGISEVAHKTEDLFALVRKTGLDMAYFSELFDVVLAVSDFLKTEVGKVQEGQTLDDEVARLTAPVISLTAKMRGDAPDEPIPYLGRVLGSPGPAVPPAPVSQPEPIARQHEPDAAQPEPDAAQPRQLVKLFLAEPSIEELELHPERYMAEAPEGGRMLGVLPEPEEFAADLAKITARAGAGMNATGGRETYYLHVHFNEGSKMENIRAFMLVNKLDEKGTVNRTIPANPETDSDAASRIIERGFYVSYTTSLFREQIETLIKGTLSVETVSFVRKLPDDPGGTDAATEPPKPEPRPKPIAPVSSPAGATADTSFQRQPAQRQKQPQPAPQQPAPQQPAPQQPAETQPANRSQAPQEQPPESRPVFVDVTLPAQPEEDPTRRVPPDRPVFVDVTKPQPDNFPALPEFFPPPPSEVKASQNDMPELHDPLHAPDQTGDFGGDTPPAHTHAGQNIISVELRKLDSLLDLVGEIVINESIVTENPDLDGLELTNFRKASRQLDKLTDELQDTVMSIRMLPVSMVFHRMRRIVRDMSKGLGKEANLVIVGEMTEVDKTILDALSDPIMHLVRNAMDHAIEAPEERAQAGKSACGHIILSAQNSGGDVIISVSDDGIGLDKNMILKKARTNGLLRKSEYEYSDKEIFNLLMAPGFSTKENVSEYSGRGVGLDVVRSNIERIGGTVIIESKKGFGTNIILKIPLTLAIISCIEIAIGGEIYAIPINNIRESFKSSAGQLVTDPTGGEMILLRGQPYPIVRLYDNFGVSDAVTDIADGILVLVDASEHSACLLADSLVGKFQVVVKPIPSYLNRFRIKRSGISGCTIMGNGNISLIVNVHDMVG